MSSIQKIFVGVFAVCIWILALFVHHQFGDIDVVALTTLCQTVLVGLGVTHLTTLEPDAENVPNVSPTAVLADSATK